MYTNPKEEFHIFTAEAEGLKLNILYDDDFFTADKKWCIGSHYHNNYEFHYICSGTTELIVNGQTVPLHCKDICIIPPFHTHYTQHMGEATKCSFLFNIGTTNAGIPNRFYDLYRTRLSALQSVLVLKETDAYHALFAPAAELMHSANPGDVFRLKLLFLRFFIDLMDTITVHETDTMPTEEILTGTTDTNEYKLMLIEQFLQNHFTDAIGVQDIAERLHLSRRQTERIIRELTGTSFCKLMIKLRMERAVELLKYSTLSTEQIAQSVGYASYSYFLKIFVETTGMTPKQVRAQMQKYN